MKYSKICEEGPYACKKCPFLWGKIYHVARFYGENSVALYFNKKANCPAVTIEDFFLLEANNIERKYYVTCVEPYVCRICPFMLNPTQHLVYVVGRGIVALFYENDGEERMYLTQWSDILL